MRVAPEMDLGTNAPKKSCDQFTTSVGFGDGERIPTSVSILEDKVKYNTVSADPCVTASLINLPLPMSNGLDVKKEDDYDGVEVWPIIECNAESILHSALSNSVYVCI